MCLDEAFLKRFYQRAVGARRDLTATGRSEDVSAEVVRTLLPSPVRACYIEKERKRDGPTPVKKAAVTSMWWAGEVRETLEGLNDRVRTAHGKREAQQVLEQRRGKGSCGQLVNGHQRGRSPELLSTALPSLRSSFSKLIP